MGAPEAMIRRQKVWPAYLLPWWFRPPTLESPIKLRSGAYDEVLFHIYERFRDKILGIINSFLFATYLVGSWVITGASCTAHRPFFEVLCDSGGGQCSVVCDQG